MQPGHQLAGAASRSTASRPQHHQLQSKFGLLPGLARPKRLKRPRGPGREWLRGWRNSLSPAVPVRHFPSVDLSSPGVASREGGNSNQLSRSVGRARWSGVPDWRGRPGEGCHSLPLPLISTFRGPSFHNSSSRSHTTEIQVPETANGPSHFRRFTLLFYK